MIDPAEINALISLLDDPDEEINLHITGKLTSYGPDIVPVLEEKWQDPANAHVRGKIEEVLETIQFNGLKEELETWAKSGAKDLFEGAYLVAKLQYPSLDKQDLSNQIDKLKLDVWLELNTYLSSLEKVRTINYILYNVHGFKGNSEDFYAPENAFLNKVMETKKGNPITLAILYSIIAQRVGLPIFGVNLPQHFALAYKDDANLEMNPSLKGDQNYISPEFPGEILFYINAFNQGVVFSKWNIDQFLRQLKLEPLEIYYQPAPNVDIIRRMFNNLMASYEKLKDPEKVEKVKQLYELLGKYSDYNDMPLQ